MYNENTSILARFTLVNFQLTVLVALTFPSLFPYEQGDPKSEIVYDISSKKIWKINYGKFINGK